MKQNTHRAFALGFALLFGQALSAQVDWQKITSITQPPVGRTVHGLCYDLHRSKAVMFGGYSINGYLNETWEFDGGNWVQITPPSSPSGRYSQVLAYDAARKKVVLFAGQNLSGFLSDTWEYDGTFWKQRFPATSPPQRNGGAVAYDAARERVVLFGGWDGTRLGDTWEWDGTNWQKKLTANSPSGRSDVQMAYDAGRRRIVLYGGYAAAAFNDTWEYDGVDWTLRTPATTTPPAYADVAMTYDAGRGKIVFFGGAATQLGQRTQDTWEWDGTDWTKLTPTLATSPSARWVAMLTYDEARGRVVMFGGMDNFALFPNDTWELVTQGVPKLRVVGQSCQGTAGTPSLYKYANGLPRVGKLLDVDLNHLPTGAANTPFLTIGASNTNWNANVLPLNLISIGMPNCFVYSSLDVVLVLPNLGGSAGASLLLPNNPPLVGQKLYLQGAVFDAGANLGGMTWTNGLALEVGR